MQNNSETFTRPTLNDLRADLTHAGEEISGILTALGNKYRVMVGVDLEHIVMFNGVLSVVANVSAEVRR